MYLALKSHDLSIFTPLNSNIMSNSEWTKMPKGQKSAFVKDFNVGNTNAASNRKTGKQAAGTSAMRSAQTGKDNGGVSNA